MAVGFADTDTVFGTVREVAERWPERPFLEVLPETAAAYGIAAGALSYGRLLDEVRQLQTAYQAAGYRAGSRVMLRLDSRPAFFKHWFALNALGLSVVPVNPDLRAAELEFMAAHASPCLAVATGQGFQDLQRASFKSGIEFPVIVPDEPLPAPASVTPVADVRVEPLRRASAMLYTSGTAGQP